MDSLAYSQKIYSVTKELLSQSNIISLLEPFGEVTLTGSYKYNLMYKPDIDMYIYNQDLDRLLFSNIAKAIIGQDYFDFFYMEDTYSHRRENIPGVPRGYYIRIDHTFKDYLFKFDIMVVQNREQKEAHYTDETRAIIQQLESENFTQAQREAIVQLKQYRNENKNSLPPIRSFDIYKAVLVEDIINPTEFVAWINTQSHKNY